MELRRIAILGIVCVLISVFAAPAGAANTEMRTPTIPRIAIRRGSMELSSEQPVQM